jgi:hypothetical protein
MKFANATNLDRKSGVAKWRDLLFLFIAVPSKLPQRSEEHNDPARCTHV